MNRLILVGGLNDGPEKLEVARRSLDQLYDRPVESYSLSYAMSLSTKEFASNINGTEVVTSGLGMLALYGSKPESVYAYGPPLPRRNTCVLAKALVNRFKTIFSQENTAYDMEIINPNEEYNHYLKTSRGRHIRTAIIRNGTIATFNPIKSAHEMQKEGTRIKLFYGAEDEYYQPNNNEWHVANELGVHLEVLAGLEHSSLINDPVHTMSMILETVSQRRIVSQ